MRSSLAAYLGRRRLLLLFCVAVVVSSVYLLPGTDDPLLALPVLGVSLAFAVAADWLMVVSVTPSPGGDETRSRLRMVVVFGATLLVLWQYVGPVPDAVQVLLVSVAASLSVLAEAAYIGARRRFAARSSGDQARP